MLALDADQLHYRIGSREILNDCSLHIQGSGLFVITGPSGAGKTTLLHILAGLLRPHDGRVIIRGDNGRNPAWIVQNSPLLEKRTARENVALGVVGAGIAWTTAQDLAADAMSMVGIEHLSNKAAYRLSGGERQRVSVARAMASRAPLVFADEPTASLDALSRDLVIAALTVAASEGATIIVTTHDPAVAAAGRERLNLVAGQLETLGTGQP